MVCGMWRFVRGFAVCGAIAVAALAAGGRTAAACDREVVAIAAPQVLSFAPAQVVSPLVVVPFDAAPVVVAAGGHRAVAVRSARAVAVRPLVVRSSSVRSVTRVRTVVR